MTADLPRAGENPLDLPPNPAARDGLEKVASKTTWPVQDAMHFLHSAEAVRTGSSAHPAIDFGAIGNTINHSLGGLLGIVAGTGVSAYLNQLVFGQHEKTMLKRYRPHLATITGQEEATVSVDDLYNAAASNPSLDEELDRNRGMRNLRTAATLVGTTMAFAAVFAAVSFFPPLAALGAAAAAGGLFSAAGAGFVAASMALSYGVLHVAGKGALKAGKKLFGYDNPTVEDHVQGISELAEKGKNIAPEQVMGVFVAASPALQSTVEWQFGKRYDKLSGKLQAQAAEMFGGHLPLEQLAAQVNNHEIDARELTFTVHGQKSGYVPEAPKEKRRDRKKAAEAEQEMAVEKTVEQQTVTQQDTPPAPQPQELRLRPAGQQAAPESQGITASQWRDMVEKQRVIEQQPGQTMR